VKITDLLQLQAIRLAAGRRALAYRVARLRSRGVRVKGLVLSGSPPAQILAVARRARCDIIVMGTRGGNALSRWLLGSVADRVVRRASCPVLTVRK
jgi:nucleotide-binding universal stress UspA family protein